MAPRFLLRRPVRGHPIWYWLGAVILAGVTAAVVRTTVAEAERDRRAWGTTRDVVVARRDLEPGDVIEAGDVERRTLPAIAAHGADLVDSLPIGRVVRDAISAGEVLRTGRLAPAGLSPLAGSLPDGTVAIAVAQPDATRLRLSTGDRVDALAVYLGQDVEAPIVVADDALVVDVADDIVTVAVDQAWEAPRLAHALVAGAVVLALTPS